MQIDLVTLKHQEKAIQAIDAVFKDVRIEYDNNIYANPILDTQDEQLYKNIDNVQNGNYSEEAKPIQKDIRNLKRANEHEPLILDIKMETGTGKTCVYTQMMYELNKYGFNKFIIVVPRKAIKAGTESFIKSDYAKSFFRRKYQNKEIELKVFEPISNNKKGKKDFPYIIREYFEGIKYAKNKIFTLLSNSEMINSKTMNTSYDNLLLDTFKKPYEAIEYTRPIVIIDEPHMFDKDNKTFNNIKNQLKPQIIIRFGATFPDITLGKGKNKKIVKDYENLIYNLGACDSFNNNLVKGVEIGYPDEIPKEGAKIKVLEIDKTNKSIKLKNEQTQKSTNINIFEDLSPISEDLSGVTLEFEDKIFKLSNGIELQKGDSFYSSIYNKSYQEIMIKDALARHFETEYKNFKRENKIKTIALFFIDNIKSYRGENDNKGKLKLLFEKLLKEQLESNIERLSKENGNEDYIEYLKYSLQNISKTHGGYFAEDWGESDETGIPDEIEDILHKERTLPIKNTDGSWNIRRFFFSKWTLKEGWDNPNVFTIAKLRTSGSEISKLQEVGRGLRLPVDVNGKRIEEQFYLNYVIDYSEKEFAQKLVDEINKDVINTLNIREKLEEIYSNDRVTLYKIMGELYSKEYIDENENLIDEKLSDFVNEYPDIFNSLHNGKIINKNKKERKTVKIRENQFNKLKDLWQVLNTKYYISFKEISEDLIIENIIKTLDEIKHIKSEINTMSEKLIIKNNVADIERKYKNSYYKSTKIAYNEFLKKITKETNIPITTMHKALVKFNKTYPINNEFFNENILKAFILKSKQWLKKSLSQYEYKKLNIVEKETSLTDKKGNVKKEIICGDVGVKLLQGYEVPETFIYDQLLYDSPLEADNLIENIDKVLVYGKIPRKSVRIPMYFGGSYSPDFMYILKSNDKISSLNFVIETKGVNEDSDLRKIEQERIDCAEKFYQKLQEDFKDKNIKIIFKKQLNTEKVRDIIEKFVE